MMKLLTKIDSNVSLKKLTILAKRLMGTERVSVDWYIIALKIQTKVYIIDGRQLKMKSF